jgi:hypothetical protein
MTRKKVLALVTGSMLAMTGIGIAQTKAPAAKAPSVTHQAKKAPMTSVMRGMIKSVNDKELVVERKTKSGSKDVTFAMNASTQKQGDLKVGAPVTVHYRRDNNVDLATSVRSVQSKGAVKSEKH